MAEPQIPPEVISIMESTGATLLQAWREYRQHSLEHVASCLNVWPANLASWERNSNPCDMILNKLAFFYGCSVIDLIE